MQSGLRLSITFVVAAVLSIGCDAVQRAAPTSARAEVGAVDRLTLQQAMFELADALGAQSAAVTRSVLAETTDPIARAEIQSFRTTFARTLVENAMAPLPESAFIDLVIDVRLRQLAIDRWLATRPADAPEQALGSMVRSENEQVDAVARRMLGAQNLAALHALVDDWDEAHVGVPPVGVARADGVADLRTSGIRADELAALAASMLAPTSAAATESQRGHLAEERLLHLMRQLPSLAGLEAELALSDVMVLPDVRSAMANLDESQRSLTRLADAIERGRQTADDIANRAAAAIEDLQRVDASGLAQFAADLRVAATEVRSTLPEARATIADLNAALEAADRVTGALVQLSKGADGKPLDFAALSGASERFATASADLREAIAGASAVLSSEDASRRLEEIARTGNMSIDHAIWRIGQLFVIAACMTIVIRIVWILTRPRGEAPPRPARR